MYGDEKHVVKCFYSRYFVRRSRQLTQVYLFLHPVKNNIIYLIQAQGLVLLC